MMWKLLRNPKLVSALGFLILIALIWSIGPFVGLSSSESRLLWTVVVMLVWVLALLLGRLLSDRAGMLLEKVLRRQTDEAVIGASADQRRDVAQLRQRLLGAIDTLKTSQLGKVSGKAALYELPWYMVIGHPAAGKSSAILHSGLDFPFGDKQAIQGVGGTRNCDWFFTTEGVLLDTAGRYSTQREDRPEWLEFLKLLKKYRSKAPANGILVAISFPELVQHKSEQFTIYARQVRERINEIDEAFGIKVPIYLVFTKIDLLGGFTQFFEDMSEDERQSVWGATLSHDQGAEFDAVRVVGQQFDMLQRGLVQIGFDKLANNRGNVSRPALFTFPIEFNAMREAVCKFVELLFQDDPYHTKPLLRGFYFTSALQEGTPRQAAGSRIASIFDLSRWGGDGGLVPASNSFFLRTLFKEVIFPDRHLITRQIKPAGNRLRLAGMAIGLSMLALLSGGMTWSFVGNQKLIANADEELLVSRRLAASGELVDRLKALQVLQLRIEQLHQYQQQGYPAQLGLGLYQGRQVEQTLRKEYFAGVREVMLMPVKASLEMTLAALHDPTPPAVSSSTGVSKPPPVANDAAPRLPGKPSGGALPVIPMHFVPPHSNSADLVTKALYRPDGRTPFLAVGSSPAQTIEAARGIVLPGGVGAAGNGGRKLEDGYNALKTYLMLKEKEHMEISHLSDQLPKYWRPWLAVNRGRGSQEEINRLAERVVAFYVSQIAEDDLPLIENRADLIGQSRDILRGAFRRLSAVERVYNELKARANTQFAPMTVGRILNSRDLDLMMGSVALPGAFTREAWEKYFRSAIGEASKGEIKGDDWVLATSSLENLSKDGNFERNRQELEATYKAEYAREWKKFLQGVAVQEFGALENAVQSLGRLADPQNSPLRQVLAKAAYETAWDNPSQLGKSLETAKNSVIERTEKLVLGSAAPSIAAVQPQLGELGGKFALLSSLTVAGEGGRIQLSAYLDILGKLKGKLAQIAANPEPGVQARQLMQATLAASGSEFAEALALVDGVLLNGVSDEAKDVIRPLLVRPLVQAYATLIPPVEQEINQVWQAEVLGQWRGLAGKYPFSDSANEASMAEIARFLKPGEGVLPRFVDKQLSGLVVRRGDQLIPRTWANLGVGFNPAFLAGVARLTSAGNAVLQDGEGTRFELQPVPTPGLSEILIEVDGQVLRYRNGPQPWTGFAWPNTPGGAAQGARIQVVSFSGVSTSVANFGGRLGWMRLLAQARVDGNAGETTQLEWRFKAGRTGDSDGEAVRFNFRVVSGANPLSLSGLRRLGLPEKITNKGV
ncbi:MAG: type VI secretion system membrane subunit TssM [Rhodocyclales bacterium GT-UBC]|nr:MAG: type VI secretion system membrane subunit TssM [Rhodocyclales bacterium GT-UBC]